MKVFFDGEIFTFQRQGGISRLFFELMRLFAHSENIEQILYRGSYVDHYPFRQEWFKCYYGVRWPFKRGVQVIRPLDDRVIELLYITNATPKIVYHSTYYRIPKRQKGPIVIHAYDMIHELYNGDNKTIKKKKTAFETADLIIAISQSTKDDICHLYGIDPSIIVVAYPGVSDVFRSRHSDTVSRSEQRSDDSRPFFLYVGHRGWYKNFDILLNVFIERRYYQDFDLILVGGTKTLSAKQQGAINRTGTRQWLKQKYCDDMELANLYANATVFICTSLYEGFGIPLIEAMACGCPIIGPNTSSIPEVIGDTGLLFDPKDPSDLAKQIERVVNDVSLSNALSEKGRLRSENFTWQAMADTIHQVYLKLT
ncbi:MAG: glycosyltransferase family 1 protein [Dehalococcoidia bacterium]